MICDLQRLVEQWPPLSRIMASGIGGAAVKRRLARRLSGP
jgi:hypothetical protein